MRPSPPLPLPPPPIESLGAHVSAGQHLCPHSDSISCSRGGNVFGLAFGCRTPGDFSFPFYLLRNVLGKIATPVRVGLAIHRTL